jgi:hypothetical protein
MRLSNLMIVAILLISVVLLSGSEAFESINLKATLGADGGEWSPRGPIQQDSIYLIIQGVDYGADATAPQCYGNAKHITTVHVGTHIFPVVVWETGDSWHLQSLFSYWDEFFDMWTFPDSFTSNSGVDTGRPAVCADSKGDLHFVWHELHGSVYDVYYTRGLIDTTGGLVTYTVESPAVLLSTAGGRFETFPVLAMYEDTLLMAFWMNGTSTDDYGFAYNYSTDGGNTWAGPAFAYDHGSPLPCPAWSLSTIAPDPTSGDMWAGAHYDITGDGSADAVTIHWSAATNTWDAPELVAAAPAMHPFCLTAIVVDYNGVPHDIWQENKINDGGSSGQLSVYPGCGPFGQLYYSNRIGGAWSPPLKLMLDRTTNIGANYQSGHPSTGIATNNQVYFATTQPESAGAGTTAYGTFNVFYACYNASDTLVTGGHVSNLTLTDTYATMYPHLTYHVPIGSEVPAGQQGPGISWNQMEGGTQPADVLYSLKDTLPDIGVEETKPIFSPSPVALYQNYPNPFAKKTMIRFTVPNNTEIALGIYDISGRLVRTLAKGIPGAGSYFVIWDGKDSNGEKVPSGVYLYKLRAGLYREAKKLLLMH